MSSTTYTPSTPNSPNKQVRFKRSLNNSTPTSSPMSHAASSPLTDTSIEEIELEDHTDNRVAENAWQDIIKKRLRISQEYRDVHQLIQTVKNKIFQKNEDMEKKNNNKHNEIYNFFQPFEFQIAAFELLLQRVKDNPFLHEKISLKSLKEGIQNYEHKFDGELTTLIKTLNLVQ